MRAMRSARNARLESGLLAAVSARIRLKPGLQRPHFYRVQIIRTIGTSAGKSSVPIPNPCPCYFAKSLRLFKARTLTFTLAGLAGTS